MPGYTYAAHVSLRFEARRQDALRRTASARRDQPRLWQPRTTRARKRRTSQDHGKSAARDGASAYS
jgi:hypothetical protein